MEAPAHCPLLIIQGPGAHAATELIFLFDDRYLHTPLSKPGCRSQPRDAAADNHDMGRPLVRQDPMRAWPRRMPDRAPI